MRNKSSAYLPNIIVCLNNSEHAANLFGLSEVDIFTQIKQPTIYSRATFSRFRGRIAAVVTASNCNNDCVINAVKKQVITSLLQVVYME
jgi:hypothetical protein